MIEQIVYVVALVAASAAAGFFGCLFAVLKQWIKKPVPSPMSINFQLDDAVLIQYMRASGYEVRPSPRQLN
jgi:hypothetical protein